MHNQFMLFESADKEEPESKRRKYEGFEYIHSSLNHCTIKAPPLVDYNTIDSYCENKRGESLLLQVSSLNNLQSFSSPIVFKTPKPILKRIPHSNSNKPYLFFNVEELSLVQSLKNWPNTKVTAVGKLDLNPSTKVYYFKCVAEEGSCQVRLDMSLLKQDPDLWKLQQLYGVLQVVEQKSRIKVNFLRQLGSVNLRSFIDSYKLMQMYVPKLLADWKYKNLKTIPTSHTQEENSDKSSVRLNDTLDCCSFSNID